MPVKTKQLNIININTVSQDIDNCIDKFLDRNGIDKDYKSLTSIKHSTVNYMLSSIYQELFKPNTTLINNQKSLIDYDNIELMQLLADKFIEICQRFNKSLGLMSFSYLIGCSYSTLDNWLNADCSTELNSKRLEVLKSIQVRHKAQHISLLNDTPVGALAVANNDHETGLEWSKNQMQVTAQSVYFLPSERVDRMRLAKPEDNNDSV